MINRRVGDLVIRIAKLSPNAAALMEGAHVVSWRELDQSTNRIANALSKVGLKKNDRVATVIRHGSGAVEMLFSLAKAGLLAVPVNYGLTPAEIKVLLDDSQPDAIIVDAEFVPMLRPILERLSITVMVRGDAQSAPNWLDFRALERAGSDMPPSVDIEPDEIRTIRYTSGTTAAPKGCLGTHRQILSSIDNFFAQLPMPATGPFLQMLPLFSGAGIWMAFAAAYHGVANVLMRDFNAQEALHNIETHRVSHTCGVPTMLSRLCEELQKGTYGIDSLELFGYTGSKMPPGTIRRALQLFPCGFYQGFGGNLHPQSHGRRAASRQRSGGNHRTLAEQHLGLPEPP
jgi:acyl-CoA synthetase (AMP-forming)/AMP-acid ligase II